MCKYIYLYAYKYHTTFQAYMKGGRNIILLLHGSVNTLNCYQLMVNLVSQTAPLTSPLSGLF